MRVGVFLEQKLSAGGGFQQALSVVLFLTRKKWVGTEFVVFVLEPENKKILNNLGVEAILIKKNIRYYFHRLWAKFFENSLGIFLPFRGYIDDALSRHKIDLVYFLGPSFYAMGLSKHNYIVTVWDQCHRDWPEFPEVRLGMEFERREFLYKGILPKAMCILVDDELSKTKMHKRYGIDLERIKVARFFPMMELKTISQIDEITLLKKYSIHRPFIFYPAQFWCHKNHAYILKALKLLKAENIFLEAVFVGNNYGSREMIEKMTKSLNIEDRVHFLGFIPRDELVVFYRKALALVMPTYFGPTNIPPLEAFSLHCPVCYSDLPGLRDQVGDAAFLMNLNEPASLVEIIKRLLAKDDSVTEKIEKGTQRLKIYSEEKYSKVLDAIFAEYKKNFCEVDFN